jgi:peptidoglycan hydrolase CwlO-like protein
MNNRSSSNRLLPAALTVIVLLLSVNAYLLYNKVNQGKRIQEQQTELTEANLLKIDLEKQYHRAISDLEEMKGSNNELNGIIDRQKEELRQQRDRIDGLLRNGRSLEQARTEINNLRSQIREYVSRIQELDAANDALRTERDALSSKSVSLTADLDSSRSVSRILEREKQALSDLRDQLSTQNNQLQEKVTLASVIQAENLVVTPLKDKSNGKAVKKRYAKNIDQFKVCFTARENPVTTAGQEIFHVRIISPVGETMVPDESVGGTILNRDTNEDMRYTFTVEMDYRNTDEEVCHVWFPRTGNFSRGDYQVEVYNKGYRCGRGTVSLK